MGRARAARAPGRAARACRAGAALGAALAAWALLAAAREAFCGAPRPRDAAGGVAREGKSGRWQGGVPNVAEINRRKVSFPSLNNMKDQYFILWARSKKVRNWCPVNIVSGSEAAKNLKGVAKNDIAKAVGVDRLADYQVVRAIGLNLYKQIDEAKKQAIKMHQALQYAKELEWGFKEIANNTEFNENPSSSMTLVNISMIPPEEELRNLLDDAGDAISTAGDSFGKGVAAPTCPVADAATRRAERGSHGMPSVAGPLPLWEDSLHGLDTCRPHGVAPLAAHTALFEQPGLPLPTPACWQGGGTRSSFFFSSLPGMGGGLPGMGGGNAPGGAAAPGSLESTAQGNFGQPDPTTAMTSEGQQAVNEQLEDRPSPWEVPGNAPGFPGGAPGGQAMVNGQAVQINEHDYPEDMQRKSLTVLQRQSAPGKRWPPALREAAAAVEQAGRILQSWIRRRQILAKELPFLGPDLEYCRRKAAAKEAAEEAEFKALEEETEKMAAQFAASRGRVVEEAGEELGEEAVPSPGQGHPGAEAVPSQGQGHPGAEAAAGLPGGAGGAGAGGQGAAAPPGQAAPPGAPPGAPAGTPPLQTAGPGQQPLPGGMAQGPPTGMLELAAPSSLLARGSSGRDRAALLVGPKQDTALLSLFQSAQNMTGAAAGAPAGDAGGAAGPGAPPGMPAELGAPGAPGAAAGMPGAAPGGSIPGASQKVLAPDCEEFSIPPSLAASRRAASEAYWSFEKALNVAEEKVEKAMNDLVEKGA